LAKKVFGSDPGPKPTEKTQRYEPSAGDVDAVKKKYPDLEKGPPARSPEAAKAAYTMLARLNRMEREGRKLEVGGVTAEEVLRKTVIGNPKVSDDMLVKMGSRTLQQLVPGDKEREEIEARQPGSRELDSHKLAVAMLSAATGIDPSQLSKYGPDLGLSGTAGAPIGLRRPETTGDHLTTAMHDFTDTLKDAGITGMNDAVWGTDDKVFSALRSFAPLMSAREALDNIQNRMRNDWRTDDVLPFDMRQI
jgi:hypothetical protein